MNLADGHPINLPVLHEMTDTDKLPEDVARAVANLKDYVLGAYATQCVETIRAGLLRLARENAELRSAAGRGELSILKDLADARETIKRLNRRVQVAEAGVAEKVKESAPGSFGRGLANAAADMFMHERDEAQAELAALKRRIAKAPVITGDEAGLEVIAAGWNGVRVALLPVGGE